MGLDVTITANRPVICPHCGQVVKMEAAGRARGSGKDWYGILERFGYYVPHGEFTNEPDWYGKDMSLTTEQAKELYQFIKEHPYIDGFINASILIARAVIEGNTVTINADW